MIVAVPWPNGRDPATEQLSDQSSDRVATSGHPSTRVVGTATTSVR
ncbi:hypothetical protein [Micromonospora cremea]|uniref:Uncharacterized protein n=1 Tax=Micromonospora cremea TaxID=709881 RepID=A0A1N5WK88_9ACTN|nr:hypothetical protein [Micromonospora cremea]SIM85639.1 hypothetical protein SAMN04489832_2537 [Micromonospora cremea]